MTKITVLVGLRRVLLIRRFITSVYGRARFCPRACFFSVVYSCREGVLGAISFSGVVLVDGQGQAPSSMWRVLLTREWWL